MEFSRQEYWSGLLFLTPGDLPNPGIEPRSPTLQANSLPAEPQGKPKSTGVGRLSLLQQIISTQESNRVFCIAGRWFRFLFFPFIFISWRLVTLQYCSDFCHTLTWISHGFICVPHPDPPSHLLLHPIPLGLPSAPALSTCLMHPTWAGDLFHPDSILVSMLFSQNMQADSWPTELWRKSLKST